MLRSSGKIAVGNGAVSTADAQLFADVSANDASSLCASDDQDDTMLLRPILLPLRSRLHEGTPIEASDYWVTFCF